MMLTVPSVAATDTLTAALAYAENGWYVLPIRLDHPDPGKRKSPGSVVGAHWQDKSSREPDQIAAWFAGTDYGIALHCGRSGAVVFDVDGPGKLPDVLREHLCAAPYQSTRPDAAGRGHYVFTQPPGRMLGNGSGGLGGAWGEVRGKNGVIVVEPSTHPEGGHYRWLTTGVVPELPDAIAEQLTDATNAADAASDAEVAGFVNGHTDAERPELIHGWTSALTKRIERGESRHDAAVKATVGAMKEAAAGYFPAADALAALKPLFINAVGLGHKTRTGSVAEAEWGAIVAWAVGQASVADLDEVRTRTEAAMPSGVNETGASGIGPDDDDAPVLRDSLLTRSALRDLPDPEPLIDGVLDQGTIALLYGKWGSGKSFIAQDWAASVATRRNWQGRGTEQRRVLYVAAEGAFGLKGRIAAWEQGWRTQIEDGTLDVLPHPVNLTRSVDVANLCALVDWSGYAVVVLDTLSRCMVGADENSARDCGQVVDVLHRIRQHTPQGRGCVLAVHHTGKDGHTFRGSSAFEGGADTVYSVVRDGDDGALVLDREKRKDGPLADVHRLKLDPIDGTGSCVISVHRGVDKPERADRLLSTFFVHFAGTGASKSELRSIADMPPATFHRALSDLLKAGDLINVGTAKRPFYKEAGK